MAKSVGVALVTIPMLFIGAFVGALGFAMSCCVYSVGIGAVWTKDKVRRLRLRLG